MSIRVSRRVLRRPMAAVLAVALAGAGLLAAAAPASAAPVAATSGSGSWAGPTGWFNYILSDGSTSPAKPAGCTPGGVPLPAECTLPLTLTSGTYDAAAGTAVAHLGDIVWNKPAHGINLQLNDLTVEIAGTTGTIKADLASTSGTSVLPQGAQSDFTLATIDLAGVTPATTPTSVAWSNLTGTFAANVGTYIGSWGSYAGTAITPLSLTLNFPAPVVTTTTGLTASPSSPQLAGTAVSLVATVSPADAVGSVQFLDGGTNLGSPIAVAGGTATLPATALAAGTHSLTAQFIPTDPALFTGSTSNAVPYTINAAPNAVATTTSTVVATSAQPAGITPADATSTSPALLGAQVTLATTVTPAAAGTVQFTDNGTPVGPAATVDAATGAASLSISTLAAGGHSLGATFSPADPAAFAPSTTATAKAFGIANPATAAACVVASPNVALSDVTASWPVSNTVWAFATRTATGNITAGATTFEFASGTGTSSSTCTELAFTGSFTAKNTGRGDYSFTFANPTLSIAPNGSGVLVADVSAAIPAAPAGGGRPATPAQDSGPTRVVVATFTGADTTPDGTDVSFSVTPAYAGTVAAGTFSGTYTDAFPVPVILAVPNGVRGQLYQSGASQPNKAAGLITAGYTYTTFPTATSTVVATSAQPAGIIPADAATTSPALLGAPVTLSTTVTPAAAGTVQFTDNGTPVGPTATVDAATGAASLSISTLAAGGHSLGATFTPANPAAYEPSTTATARAFGIANPATAAACTVGATGLPVTGVTASWPVSGTVWAFATRTATGNITAGATAFEFAGGTGTSSSTCTELAFTGSFTAKNTGRGDYSFTFANPTLSIAANGSGVLVADVSAAIPAAPAGGGRPATPAQDSGPTRVVVATFTGANTAPVGGDVDFSVTPANAGTVAAGTFSGAFTDAFPVPAILAVPAGIRGQLHQTSASQPTKAAGIITAGWTIPTYGPQVSPSLSSVEQGQTITFTGTGFAPNEPVAGVVNSDPVSLGSALASADGTVAFTWTVPANFAVGVHSIVLTGALSGATASATFEVTAPPPACVARTVSGATFSWGVKSSFAAYITGSIANGTITRSGVTGQFTWSGGTGSANPAAALAIVNYGGTVSFSGHDGLLQLTIANPTIQITGPSSALLLLDVTSKSLDSGETTRRSGVAFATLALGAGSNGSTADRIAYTGVPATLTAGGATVFAGFYPAGTALDAVSFALPLGAEVPCTAALNPSSPGSLASTGTSATTHGLLAMLVLSVGAGLVLIGRRRIG